MINGIRNGQCTPWDAPLAGGGGGGGPTSSINRRWFPGSSPSLFTGDPLPSPQRPKPTFPSSSDKAPSRGPTRRCQHLNLTSATGPRPPGAPASTQPESFQGLEVRKPLRSGSFQFLSAPIPPALRPRSRDPLSQAQSQAHTCSPTTPAAFLPSLLALVGSKVLKWY